MIDEIANELIVTSKILGTNNVSEIGRQIGYRPVMIINALYRGSESGKFVWNKKKDIIKIAEDVEVNSLSVSEGMSDLLEQIEVLTGYLNTEEKDMSYDELEMLFAGVPQLHLKIAVWSSKKLTTYDIAQPGDKDSVYTFVTMKENAEKQFGQKQFNAKKSKASQIKKPKAE